MEGKPGKVLPRAWGTGMMWSVRAQLGDTSGTGALPKPEKKNGSGLPGLAICGQAGVIWEPPLCENWLQGSGGAGSCGDGWEKCPRSTVGCWRDIGSVWDHDPGRKSSGITVFWMPRVFQVGISVSLQAVTRGGCFQCCPLHPPKSQGHSPSSEEFSGVLLCFPCSPQAVPC